MPASGDWRILDDVRGLLDLRLLAAPLRGVS